MMMNLQVVFIHLINKQHLQHEVMTRLKQNSWFADTAMFSNPTLHKGHIISVQRTPPVNSNFLKLIENQLFLFIKPNT